MYHGKENRGPGESFAKRVNVSMTRLQDSQKEFVRDWSQGNPLARCFRSSQEAMELEKNQGDGDEEREFVEGRPRLETGSPRSTVTTTLLTRRGTVCICC